MNKLWIDLTTSFEEQGRYPHGTMRVGAGIVGAFTVSPPANSGFMAFCPALNCFKVLSLQQVRVILSAPLWPLKEREHLALREQKASS